MKRRHAWFARSASASVACSAWLWLPIATRLILLHSVEGHEVTISPDQVTSLRAAIPHRPNQLITEDVACLVNLTDGKFISVIESCAEVRTLLEAK